MGRSQENNVTVKDIAREAGVSPALVSFVMRNASSGKRNYRVNPDTAFRVLDVARRMNYHPNTSARALKSGKYNTIGMILSDIANPFFAEIARMIEDEAYKNGYSVLFGSTDEDSKKLEQLAHVFIDKGIDGCIVVPSGSSAQCVKPLLDKRIPLVFFDRAIDGIDMPSVLLNNVMVSHSLTQKLIEKGYRFIEMVSYSMDLSNIRGREDGYKECMREAGLDCFVNIHRVEHHESSSTIDGIMADARKRGVEAFVFATNALAVQGMSAIFRNGFNIPQDFGIATFDKNDAFDIYATDLLYVRQPLESFAKDLIRILVGEIRGDQEFGAAEHIVLGAEIVNKGAGR